MIIVSDTSVLSGLLVIDKLDLLDKIYGKVIIPKVVFDELLGLESYGYDLSPIHEASWLEISEASDKNLETELNRFLDKGESAAIALARELNPTYLAIDEKKGRAAAEALGIPIIGLVGILIFAKEKNYLSKVKPVLDMLIEKAGFRIGRKFYDFILHQVNE